MSAWLEHVTAEPERWDAIAYRYYADATRYLDLIEANRGLFPPEGPVPLVLPAGTLVRVPVLPEEPAPTQLPPWKRSAP